MAQICINSFYRSLQDSFYSARFRDLKRFFEQYANLKKFGVEIERIKVTLNYMNKYFGENAEDFRNRASIVSAYLFFEELIIKKEIEKLQIFAEFYIKFINKLRIESGKGLDYDRKYRKLMDFQYYISQAAVAKSSIEKRHELLGEYF